MKRVQFLATCLIDHLFPHVGLAAVEVLERAGVAVSVPAGQTCCGQPAFNAGFVDEARSMARHTVDVLSREDTPVVVPSGSCADMLIHHAPVLLADQGPYATRARSLAARTYEFTRFLVDVLKRTDCGACHHGSVTYHPSCHGLRGLNVDRQPHDLLNSVKGADVRPLRDAETCCGFGGLFAVKMNHVSGAMLNRKLECIEETGAETVIATDMSCLMHIAGGLRRSGSHVAVKHLAEVLAERADGVEPGAASGAKNP